jgi:hypothetical protein
MENFRKSGVKSSARHGPDVRIRQSIKKMEIPLMIFMEDLLLGKLTPEPP